MVNICEAGEKVVFEPLSLINKVNGWIEQRERDTKRWELVMEEDYMRIWLRSEGLSYNSDLPVMQVETYFPDVEDPAIIFAALLHRKKFEADEFEEMEFLPHLGGDQIVVERSLSKKTVVAPREFINKKVYFSA